MFDGGVKVVKMVRDCARALRALRIPIPLAAGALAKLKAAGGLKGLQRLFLAPAPCES